MALIDGTNIITNDLIFDSNDSAQFDIREFTYISLTSSGQIALAATTDSGFTSGQTLTLQGTTGLILTSGSVDLMIPTTQGTSGQVLAQDGTGTGQTFWTDLPGSIYTGDSTMTGDRIINANSYALSFSTVGAFVITTDSTSITSTTTLSMYSVDLDMSGTTSIKLTANNIDTYMPTTQGTTGQVLTNDGTGITSWASLTNYGEMATGNGVEITTDKLYNSKTVYRQEFTGTHIGLGVTITDSLLLQANFEEVISMSEIRFTHRVGTGTEYSIYGETAHYDQTIVGAHSFYQDNGGNIWLQILTPTTYTYSYRIVLEYTKV
jgi:hypothetical protein